jgi:putative DNA primase/helicase
MEELKKYMASLGFEVSVECSGAVERFPRRGKDNVGWVIAKKISAANREIIVAHFGDWSTGESHKFETAHSDADPIENAEILKEIKAQEESSRQLKKESQEAAKKRAEYIYSTANGNYIDHKYLTNKKLQPIPLTKFSPTGDLVCPVFDILTSELTSLQFIKSDGTKTFLPGGRLKGAGFLWQPTRRPERILVAEGIATAASIHEASPNDLVVAAFYASNLFSVCDALRKKHRDVTIYVCADNDAYKEKNTGLDAARAVGQRVSNTHVLYPSFTGGLYEIEQPKDWNDYHAIHGLPKLKEELMRQIAAVNMQPTTDTPAPVKSCDVEAPTGFENLPQITHLNDRKKPICPTQEMLARSLTDYFGDDIVRQGDDLFFWEGTHWEHQDQKEVKHLLRRAIQYMAKGMCDNTDLNATYQMFLSMVNRVPPNKNMFAPNPFATSISDGTIWVNPKSHDIEFAPHNKKDYLTLSLPFRWHSPKEENVELIALLERTYGDEPDKEEIIRALKQMAGACLVPCFPHLFFLWGPPGSGKSTLAKLCGLLVTQKYRSRVQPKEMGERFGMQPMINKLVNIHTELSQGLIDDSILKMIEDREPINVERKGISSVDAYIPAVHIYCCNNMPRSIEGGSNAYDRRVTILEFKKVVEAVKSGTYTRDYEQTIFDSSPNGFFQWAKEGLIDLVKSGGIYKVPGSGLGALEKWKLESDQVAQFLECVAAHEIGPKGSELIMSVNGSVRAGALLEFYRNWARGAGIKYPLSRNKFYDAIRKKGFVDQEDRDNFLHFCGLCVVGQETSALKPGETSADQHVDF